MIASFVSELKVRLFPVYSASHRVLISLTSWAGDYSLDESLLRVTTNRDFARYPEIALTLF
jgi:hypothetical protein